MVNNEAASLVNNHRIVGVHNKENILGEKSLLYAARILKLYKYLLKTKKETIVSNQIIRCGTSIGANINEANYGQSIADFIAKLHIALKETSETEYWLNLLILTDCIDRSLGDSLLADCRELKRMLVASIKTAKSNPSK